MPPPDRSDYDIVGVNNYDAGRRVAVHMIAAGAKRISFVSMPKPCYSIRYRFAGVQSVLASHGVLLKEMSELDASNVGDVRRFLRKERPDGSFAVVTHLPRFSSARSNSLASAFRKTCCSPVLMTCSMRRS